MKIKTPVLIATLFLMICACTANPKDSKPAQVVAVNTGLEDFGILPTPSTNTTTSVSALLRFVEIDNGGTLIANTDSSTGLPSVSVKVESNDSRLPVGLEADGLLVAIDTNNRGKLYDQIKLKWTPWHGNGRYVLNLQLLDGQNRNIPSSQVIIVNVAGISENVPTMKSRFIELYKDHFGLNLTAPVFARYNASDQTVDEKSRWVSTSYIKDQLLELNIFDNGAITSTAYSVNSNKGAGFCRPSGSIRMLAVIVDYGNTGLNPTEAEAALQIGLEKTQKQWIDYSRQIGLSEPILKVILKTIVYRAPPQAGRYVTAEEIRTANGLNAADFDLLVEIDLDKDNTTTSQYGGVGVSLGDGCRPLGSRRTNIAFNVRDQNSLESAMPGSVFEHELIHSLGWMHWWPNQSGDGQSWVDASGGWEPYLLFGWTDVDGDGVIEILDPTPYGLIQ